VEILMKIPSFPIDFESCCGGLPALVHSLRGEPATQAGLPGKDGKIIQRGVRLTGARRARAVP
jgi:hypothetical protein